MKISAGLAEINAIQTSGKIGKTEKAFVWPVYNAGKVERIHSFARRTESNAYYSKPSNEDHLKLLDIYMQSEETEYTKSGITSKKTAISQPSGNFFDAVV